MKFLVVRFKLNTSPEWAENKLEQIGLDRTRFGYVFEVPNGPLSGPLRITVEVSEEDEIRISRAILLISPQVVSVSSLRA